MTETTPNTATPNTTTPSTTENERPPQIVITMTADLKRAVQAKAKSQKTPVTRAVRKLLQDWVEGRIELPEEAVAAAKKESEATSS